jgi:hypothetical protein
MEFMIKDPRDRGVGIPLRRSEEVMYLPIQGHGSLPSENLPEYIYESQISVMVSGIDDWVWTAYCFVDVYFKGNKHTETVEHYSSDAINRMDPHSCGKHAADRPVWDPRKYFLRSLSARMEQAREEWDNSVSLLMYQIDPYVCAPSTIKIIHSKLTYGNRSTLFREIARKEKLAI